MSNDYCSILTQKLHVDGCGTAPTNIKYFLFVEIPKPWPEKEKSIEGFPSFVYGLAKGTLKLHLIAPGEFSQEGYKKVIFFKIAENDAGHYTRREYSIPDTERDELITSLLTGNSDQFNNYKNTDKDVRDFFICGHATHDYCCGQYGNALYESFGSYLKEHKESYPTVKIWQTTHLKGHKFAPTIADFPEGRYWAHLTEKKLFNEVLPIKNMKDISDLKIHIRGLTGTNQFGQLAERELFLLYGPSWIEKKKQIEVIEDPEDKQKAIVIVTFENGSGMEKKTITVNFLPEKIEVANHLCGEPSTFKKAQVIIN